MNSLTNYIVFHDKESFNHFHDNNKDLDKTDFKFINVGKRVVANDVYLIQGTYFYNCINAIGYTNNIELHKSLLTFTAWYLLAKNDICRTDYIGIYEYDVKFLSDPNEIELNKNTIYGFNKRELPDHLYLDGLPNLKRIMKDELTPQTYWNATSNFIMHKDFLIKFVDWYMKFVPEILEYRNHSHFHERAINIFASKHKYKNKFVPLLEHFQLCSHGINL